MLRLLISQPRLRPNTTGAFYYDARDAVGIALSNITQTGADVDSELQTAQETLEFTMGA